VSYLLIFYFILFYFILFLFLFFFFKKKKKLTIVIIGNNIERVPRKKTGILIVITFQLCRVKILKILEPIIIQTMKPEKINPNGNSSLCPATIYNR